MGGEAKVGGFDGEVLDGDILGFRPANQPAKRLPGARNLIKFLRTANDEGLGSACDLESLSESGAELLPRDTDNAGLEDVLDGVRQGTDVVEDGAPGELFPDGGDIAHARVEDGGEEEGVVGGGVDGVESGWGDGLDDGGTGLHVVNEVGGAGFGGASAVAVLGDEEEGGGDDGGCGGDVEGVVGVASGANDVALRVGRK